MVVSQYSISQLREGNVLRRRGTRFARRPGNTVETTQRDRRVASPMFIVSCSVPRACKAHSARMIGDPIRDMVMPVVLAKLYSIDTNIVELRVAEEVN